VHRNAAVQSIPVSSLGGATHCCCLCSTVCETLNQAYPAINFTFSSEYSYSKHASAWRYVTVTRRGGQQAQPAFNVTHYATPSAVYPVNTGYIPTSTAVIPPYFTSAAEKESYMSNVGANNPESVGQGQPVQFPVTPGPEQDYFLQLQKRLDEEHSASAGNGEYLSPAPMFERNNGSKVAPSEI
jgi:hypothetical protein